MIPAGGPWPIGRHCHSGATNAKTAMEWRTGRNPGSAFLTHHDLAALDAGVSTHDTLVTVLQRSKLAKVQNNSWGLTAPMLALATKSAYISADYGLPTSASYRLRWDESWSDLPTDTNPIIQQDFWLRGS